MKPRFISTQEIFKRLGNALKDGTKGEVFRVFSRRQRNDVYNWKRWQHPEANVTVQEMGTDEYAVVIF